MTKVSYFLGETIDSAEVSRRYLKTVEFAKLMTRNLRSGKDIRQKYGLSDPEVTMLNLIDQNPDISSVELAQIWNCTKGAITHFTNKLEKLGLIEKVQEGKKVRLITTAQGKEVAEEDRNLSAEMRRKYEYILTERGITIEDMNTFYKVLDACIEINRRQLEEQE